MSLGYELGQHTKAIVSAFKIAGLIQDRLAERIAITAARGDLIEIHTVRLPKLQAYCTVIDLSDLTEPEIDEWARDIAERFEREHDLAGRRRPRMTRFYRTMTDKELSKALDSASPEEVQDAIAAGDLLPGRRASIRATVGTGMAIPLGSPDNPPRVMEEDAGAPDALLIEARKQTALLEDILDALKRRKD